MNSIAPPLPQMLRAAEVAEMLGISVRTVWRLDADGKLRSVRVGRRSRRWRLRSIEDYIARSAA